MSRASKLTLYLGTILMILTAVGSGAFAQNASLIPQPDSAVPAVSRADLARSFLRFEQALDRRRPDAEMLKSASKSFDGLTSRFFMGDFSGAIAALNRLTRGLEAAGAEEPDLGRRVAEALKVEANPPTCDRRGSVTLRIAALYSVTIPDGERVDVRVLLKHPESHRVIERSVALTACSAGELLASVPLDLEKEATESGWWSIRVGPAGRPIESVCEFEVGKLCVLPEGTLATRREELLAALDRVDPRGGALADALVAARSRAGTLSDRPSATRSAEFLFDPIAMAREVESELRALERGENPYTNRCGDWWRGIPMEGRQQIIPARIYAPLDTPGQDKQAPKALVIALHGAGGDESMFMDAYGNGEIKRQADRHGFIVVSPSTARGATPSGFDAIVASMKANYPIDPSRIYVVGHSMGAMGAANLAGSRGDRIAGIVCFAGGPTRRGSAKPAAGGKDEEDPGPAVRQTPILIIAGGVDSVIPPARLRPMAERARAAGEPIEYREVPELGHTLLVGAKLNEALQWLLQHRIAPP